ncbi:hypothetical protein, partial [Skermania sp. ID1734]|uniref:hypothetical protein n=1 Tax=Skermania sp. ID1734 TaxID=2597516 RepID=UPI001C8F4C45
MSTSWMDWADELWGHGPAIVSEPARDRIRYAAAWVGVDAGNQRAVAAASAHHGQDLLVRLAARAVLLFVKK